MELGFTRGVDVVAVTVACCVCPRQEAQAGHQEA
jgi:hypothetical protein